MVTGASGGVKPGSVLELERRLYRQLIVGKQKVSHVQDDLDPDLESVAFKLDIERAAVFERIEKQQKARDIYLAVSTQLTNSVMGDVQQTLADFNRLLQRSSLTAAQLGLFEQLCRENPDMGRLRLLMTGVSWLSRDLLNLVNSPAFRQRHPQRADVQVSDIKLVLNFIGVESLRKLIPYYCMRNWLGAGHSCLLWTNRKLWQYALICAIAAKALAKLHNRNETLAFVCALLQQFGVTMVLNSAASVYEKHWGTWLREASTSRDKELYDAVMITEFPAERVLDEVVHHGARLGWEIPSRLEFENHEMITNIKSLDQSLSIVDLPMDAQIQAKANCFATAVTLDDAKLLAPQDLRLLFRYYGMTEQEVLRLKGQNYRKLDLF